MRALARIALGAAVMLGACGSDRAGLTPDGGVAGSSAGVGAAGTTGSAGTSAGVANGGHGGGPVDAGATGGAGAAGAIDAGAGDVIAVGFDAGRDVEGADGGVSLPAAAVPGCSKDGWCWSTPAPQGNPLYSISGSGSSDVWAVGESGAIVHFDGTEWTQVGSGVQTVFYGVWAAAANDAWAVGAFDVILHWSGAAWAPAAGVPTTGHHWRAVWGTGPSDLWIVGDDLSVQTFYGAGGSMLHWDGAKWTMYSGPESLDAVWGTGRNDVWGLGGGRGLYHWDGKAWSTVSTEATSQIGTSLWGSSSSDLWLSARSTARPNHWDGSSVAVSSDTSADINGLWGSGPDDVWAVGDVEGDFYADGGLILHWNGSEWEQVPSAGASHLYGVWGSRADDVWAAGESGELIHWNGFAWSPPAGPPHINLFSVWANAPDDVWAFGYDRAGLGALRWNGQTWTRTELLDKTTLGSSEGFNVAPYAAWGSGSNDVWVVATDWEPIGDTDSNTSRQMLLHWDGHAWSIDSSLVASFAAGMSLDAIWGNGPKDVWAVGSTGNDSTPTGVAVHWDGTRWSPVTSLPPQDLAGPFVSVWSSGPNDVWIGGSGAVHHWDGASWSRPLTSPDNGFFVAGSGANDVWAVTSGDDDATEASHWDGSAWKHVAVGDFGFPRSVVAISATNAWMIAYDAVVHWDGTTWAVSDAGTEFLSSNLAWDGKGLWTIAMRGLIRHP